MTPSEADQRIILSRHTLARYTAMADAGNWPIGDLELFRQETMVLTSIATEHPPKADKLVELIAKWTMFRHRVMDMRN